MKRKTLCLLAVLLIILVSIYTCSYIQESKPFAPVHSRDMIDKVEITKRISSDAPSVQEKYVCLYELQESEWTQLFEDLSKLEYDVPFGDGMGTNIGSIAIRITYSNGNIELIGYVNSIYYHDDRFTRRYHMFAYEDFRNLLAEYADENLFPDWR